MRAVLLQLVRVVAAVEFGEAGQVGGGPVVLALQELVDLALGSGALFDGGGVGGAGGEEGGAGGLQGGFLGADGGFEAFDPGVAG